MTDNAKTPGQVAYEAYAATAAAWPPGTDPLANGLSPWTLAPASVRHAWEQIAQAVMDLPAHMLWPHVIEARTDAETTLAAVTAERDRLRQQLYVSESLLDVDAHRWHAVVEVAGGFWRDFAATQDGLRVFDDEAEFEAAAENGFEP